MAKRRVYLDVCCLNHPTDDLSITRNRLEAEAVLAIVAQAERGDWDLLGSAAIEYELSHCSDPIRRHAAAKLLVAASSSVAVGQSEYERASELARLGLGDLDALHVACAEAGGCDVLLSTDDVFLKRAERHRSHLRIRVGSPLSWLVEQES